MVRSAQSAASALESFASPQRHVAAASALMHGASRDEMVLDASDLLSSMMADLPTDDVEIMAADSRDCLPARGELHLHP